MLRRAAPPPRGRPRQRGHPGIHRRVAPARTAPSGAAESRGGEGAGPGMPAQGTHRAIPLRGEPRDAPLPPRRARAPQGREGGLHRSGRLREPPGHAREKGGSGMSTESNRILLKHHLEKLRLPTVRREWESVAAACASEGVAYGDFLLRLTERELIEREQRAAQRRVKSAKFPVLKTLDA